MALSLSAASGRRGVVLVGLLVLGLIAVAVVWRVHTAGDATSDASAAAAGNADTAADPNGVSILLGLAQTSINDHRLVAPVGSNAYEFYFSVLQLDQRNQTARKRLHETFASACDDAERAINQGELDEAQRELRLLHDYDATNYKLALLGGYLDAQRMLLVKKHEAEATLIQERQSAAGSAN